MASYNGTVVLTGMISPTDTTDTYPTHEDILGKGGHRSVPDLTARDSIPPQRRKIGMLVFVESNGLTYQLIGGIENSNWVEFTSGNNADTTPTLNQTTISVSGIINSIFLGISIPDGEILYVRGNANEIDTTVYSGELATVLEENKYNDFIIKYDGTSSVVYVNSNVAEEHVQNIISAFPIGYESIDLSLYTISTKISTLLQDTYTDMLQTFSYTGLVSTLSKEKNTFNVLNDNKEFVVIYDGSTFTAFKKNKVSIDDLKKRMVIN